MNRHLLYAEHCARHKEHRQVVNVLGVRERVNWSLEIDCKLLELDVQNLGKK